MCVYVCAGARTFDVQDRRSKGRRERQWKFYGNCTQKNSHAISNVNVQFMSNISETTSVSIIRACDMWCGCALHLYPQWVQETQCPVVVTDGLEYSGWGQISHCSLRVLTWAVHDAKWFEMYPTSQLTSLGCNQIMTASSAKQSMQPVTLATN
jgi:hypothetical protein